MSVSPLYDANFFVSEGSLKLNARGNVMVLFTRENCDSCKHFEPIFEGQIIPTLENEGWIFGKYVADHNPGMATVQKSKNTRTPLAKSPTLILYSNGVPIGFKEGFASADSVINFARSILSQYRNTRSVPRPNQPVRSPQGPPRSGRGEPPKRPPNRVPARRPNPQQRQNSNVKYSSTGVPIIDGMYGVPYNMGGVDEFIDYNAAYKKDAD